MIQKIPLTSTLVRFEQCADRKTAVAIHEVLFEPFVASHAKPPWRLILDFDAADSPLHGEQEGQFFHGYYRGYCYLPLYVFCGRHLWVSYLRPSGVDAAHPAWAIVSLLIKALRARWPRVEIVFRGTVVFAGGGCCAGAKPMAWAILWESPGTPVCNGRRRRCWNAPGGITRPRPARTASA